MTYIDPIKATAITLSQARQDIARYADKAHHAANLRMADQYVPAGSLHAGLARMDQRRARRIEVTL